MRTYTFWPAHREVYKLCHKWLLNSLFFLYHGFFRPRLSRLQELSNTKSRFFAYFLLFDKTTRRSAHLSTMKISTISAALALLATSALASPVPADAPSKRQFEAQITFQGAPPDVAFYTLSFPTDGSLVPICKSPPLFSIPLLSLHPEFPLSHSC